MDIRKLLYLLTFFISCFTSVNMTLAQSKGSDELFADARKAAFDEGNYTKSIALSKQALSQSPQYTDIVVFLGRVYTWRKQLDSAEYYFKLALQQKTEMEDAYVAYADMLYWNDKNDEALRIAVKGLSYSPNSQELLIRKAKLHESLRQYEEAAFTIDSLLRINNNNAEARALDIKLRDFISKNKIGVTYDVIYFDKQFPDPWHLTSLTYSRQTKMGSFSSRMNYANRFNSNGLQFEVDAYPRISKTFYCYVSAGYSDSNLTKTSSDTGKSGWVFPRWRTGFSLYVNLPRSFEAEAGVRYLRFATSTFIYTAYIGKYYSNYLFGVRTFLVPSDSLSLSNSYSAFCRYYFGGVDDYASLTLGYGISPDDRALVNEKNYQRYIGGRMKSYKAIFECKKSIRKLNVIGFNLSVINQEYPLGLITEVGNQIQIGISYLRRF